MKIRVMWTYVANFSDFALELAVPEGQTVFARVHQTYKYFSKDFWEKATFHIFYNGEVDVVYENVPASVVKEEAMNTV